MIGGGALGTAREFKLKIKDFCVCLADRAHGIDVSHEIFHKPFPVDLKFEERPTPAHYLHGLCADHLGPTMAMWRVQTRGWTLDSPPDATSFPGMVAAPYGLTDSPDGEYIAAGLNLKSHDAVAIGRHGNFLLWGFHAAPRDLTPEARKCFLNAICYIRKFDGQKPVVHANGRAREWALEYAYNFKIISSEAADQTFAPPSIRDDPAKLKEYHRQHVESYQRGFSERVQRLLGDDPDKYIAYYKANLEYLYHPAAPRSPWEVDDDVQGLRISNRSILLVDRCVQLLERGDPGGLGARILARYTNEHFTDAKGWRGWLESSRSRIFFSDVCGYKFLVVPQGMIDSAARIDPTRALLDGPSKGKGPVLGEARFSESRLSPSGEVDLVITLNVAERWHILALDPSGRSSRATVFALTLPKGLETSGDWRAPQPARGLDGQPILEGEAVFRRTIRVAKDAPPGVLQVDCSATVLACDPFHCRPRETITFHAQGRVANGLR